MKIIPYGKQSINQEDINAVIEVLQSDFLTQGPRIESFEEALKSYCKVKYAVAANSATSCLHLACLAIGLKPGDYLWTSPISFLASANCGLYCGAQVDFVDIDPFTYNLCPKALEQKLLQAKKDNCLPKVVVPVHFAGQACDLKRIRELSKEYGFYVVEDAAHAIGSLYEGKPIGDCRYSDFTVFSFHPVKVMTTAEGGALVTNNSVFADKARLLRSHSVTRDESEMQSVPDGPWDYQMLDLGYNYRMTELQAALGITQLQRLDSFVQRRNTIAQKYFSAFESNPLILPYQKPETYSAWHLFVVCIDSPKIRKTRKEIFVELRERGIGVNVHFIPIHTQPYYKKLGFKQGDFPCAETYYKNCITLPIYFGLGDDEQNKIITEVHEVLI